MSTTGKEYKLAIRIAGVVDKSFNVSLASANSSLKKTILAVDNDFTKLDKGFDVIMESGQKCFETIAAAASMAAASIAAATVAAITVGSDFESAFTGVKKTVDTTAEGYERLKEDILDMTRVIPASAAEIAGVMEIAGQLGIAVDSLTDFTKVMINLGESTNMSAEDAATDLAKFANIVNMADYGADGISNWERLGSVVVDLGNNFATTEADIVSMATRLASTGNLVGLSEAQILALSTAMNSVGIEAEAGGSSMSKLLKRLQLAVELNTESLEDYAAVANMTGEQFAQTFQKDAVVALSAFIDGLNDTERNGKTAIAILDDLQFNEVRLSNTILALSRAEGLMTNAIATANTAWDENTALAIEAGKRYETVESQVVLARNAFQELGIEAYDEMRPMIVDALGAITDKVHDFSDSKTIQKWIQNISTEFPTMKRKFTKFAEPVFDGIVDAGKWVAKNGDGIISVIVGIGSALGAYKVASTISHISTAIMSFGSLNPVTLGIMGAASAIGVLAGAVMNYKQHEQALIDDNLQRHFGDIALSMEDLQRVAKYIVSSDSLGGVKRALEAFEDLNVISATIEDAVSEIDKMNWKVSIGMELTAEEQETYQQTIADYVEAAQDYALQSQYAVSLNLSVGLSDDDLESQNVVEKVNQFYADKYAELSALGTQLNEVVTDAFNDGLLDIKETKVIADIQRQMAEIQQALATGEFDAQLSILGMEYAGGGSLTADSFQNLQEELANQVAAATEAYRESYVKNFAAIQAAYEAGDYLDESEYQAALENLQTEYLSQVGALQARSINFQLETIMETYSSEIAEYQDAVNAALDKWGDSSYDLDWEQRPGAMWEALLQDIYSAGPDDNTKKAIELLLEGMSGQVDELNSLVDKLDGLSPEVQAAWEETLNDIATLQGMTARRGDGIFGYGTAGDVEGLSIDVANRINNSINYDSIKNWVAEMHAWSQDTIDDYYSQGFDTEADVRIQLNPLMNLQGLVTGSQGLKLNLDLPSIDHNATGDIIRNKELSWLAENGPEAVIPLDGSSRAVSLWEKTGQLLGMESAFDKLDLDAGNAAAKIEYKPTLQFYGDAPSKDDLTEALRISQDDFDDLMDRYLKTHGRVSY